MKTRFQLRVQKNIRDPLAVARVTRVFQTNRRVLQRKTNAGLDYFQQKTKKFFTSTDLILKSRVYHQAQCLPYLPLDHAIQLQRFVGVSVCFCGIRRFRPLSSSPPRVRPPRVRPYLKPCSPPHFSSSTPSSRVRSLIE